MERDRFLARLRDRLDAAPPAASPAHPPVPCREVAVPLYRRSLADLTAAFIEEAGANGVKVRRVAGGGLGALLAEVVATHGVRTAVLSRDPETDGVAPLLAALGVEELPWDGAEPVAAADLGVTGAAFGIAATGSIVVDAGRAGGRSASLLPPVHLALVDAGSLLSTPADLLRGMGRIFPDGPPSQMVMITGPSKTGDIELVLVTGVHGPGHLWIGLLEEA